LKIKYLLFLVLLYCGCKTENKKAEIIQTDALKKDTVFETQKVDYFQYKDYKVGHVNDGYGKRLYIDSLHFNIVKRYYKSDSTKLWFEHYDDFVNDTILNKEYYKNGNLKFIKRTTYRNWIPIGIWEYYKSNSELKQKKNFDNKFEISFKKAIIIAKQNGIKKPYETRISEDSLCWEVINWKNVKFDSITNQGTDKGNAILINRENGVFEIVERTRKWVR
jgi:hypothetical protein